MSFKDGMEKVGMIIPTAVGAAIGALGGGEKDESGKTKNRRIGAARGVAGTGGYIAAARLFHGTAGERLLSSSFHHGTKGNPRLSALLAGAAIAGTIGSGIAGAVGGYKLMKHHGYKYDYEKKTQGDGG